jgi:prepilin-type N-terminal cleavage/methylation domain-containing protein
MTSEAGWTLMEMMVVTSLIAILAAIAIPQFTALSVQMRTNAAANELLDDIQFARVMSLRTGVPHYISPNSVTGGTGVNYKVQREAAPPLMNATDPAPHTVNLGPKLFGVAFTQNGASTDCFGGAVATAVPAQALWFNARGLPSAAASYFIGSTDGRNQYVISVTGAGRARLCHRVNGVWQ